MAVRNISVFKNDMNQIIFEDFEKVELGEKLT